MHEWKGFSKLKIQALRKPQEEGTSAQKSLEGAFLREGGREVGEGGSTKEAGSSGTGAQGSENPSPPGDKKHTPSLCKRCPELFALQCQETLEAQLLSPTLAAFLQLPPHVSWLLPNNPKDEHSSALSTNKIWGFSGDFLTCLEQAVP